MTNRPHRSAEDLDELARQAMLDHGLEPEFPPAVEQELSAIRGAARTEGDGVRDLRKLLWFSIDNDDSMDLDQISVAEDLGGGKVRLMVGIADVDAVVKQGSAIDEHARRNTTSVYTAFEMFPMLPRRLSEDLTSLAPEEERLAVVTEMVIDGDGTMESWEIYRALVKNRAKLAYDGVGAWLEGDAEAPPEVTSSVELQKQLRLHHDVTQRLRERRAEEGALDLETIEPRVVKSDHQIRDLEVVRKNAARDLIEDVMIAANRASARFLKSKNFPSIRRVLRVPERWDRIMALAAEHGFKMSPTPDANALHEFLRMQKKKNPTTFPDISLAVVKMLGSGEYDLLMPGEEPLGHFGLAIRDYLHSTAPNRRYPDIITQRLMKAALAGKGLPYQEQELEELARHCTVQEDEADKVERQMRKSAAALILSDRVGQKFDGIVTGASKKGTWVRLFHPPVEGKLMHGFRNLDVGDRVRVKLIGVDVEKGFIDFVRSGH
ncbi:MAG: RNB domain-containing ribonuclease [Thermoanaerobaculia bacterium]